MATCVVSLLINGLGGYKPKFMVNDWTKWNHFDLRTFSNFVPIIIMYEGNSLRATNSLCKLPHSRWASLLTHWLWWSDSPQPQSQITGSLSTLPLSLEISSCFKTTSSFFVLTPPSYSRWFNAKKMTLSWKIKYWSKYLCSYTKSFILHVPMKDEKWKWL